MIQNETLLSSQPDTSLPYELQVSRNPWWAMEEGTKFFSAESNVHLALKRIVKRFAEHNINYALAGGMALSFYEFPRFTSDIVFVVTPQSLQIIHSELIGRGYLPLFEGSKNIRDTENKVKIEFLVTGLFPGDGKPKPITYPDPEFTSVEIDGVRCLSLSQLVTLKLAAGMTGVGRFGDFGDVQRLIQIHNLPISFADELDPYVQEKYREVWFPPGTNNEQ